MRRIINSTFITLDGAVENPHLWPSLGPSGEALGFQIQDEQLQECDALIMGRRTYDSFAAAWPARAGNSVADRLNSMPKYVASTTLREAHWNNTTVIGHDLVGAITRLKQQPGKGILQYGLGPVSFAMLDHGLLDELRLWMHPLLLGREGPRAPHFLDCPAARLRWLDSRALPNGVVVLRYEVERAEA
jgi:dihydrofolate reductase